MSVYPSIYLSICLSVCLSTSNGSLEGTLVVLKQGRTLPPLIEHRTGHLKETQSSDPVILKNKVERQTGPYGLYRV